MTSSARNAVGGGTDAVYYLAPGGAPTKAGKVVVPVGVEYVLVAGQSISGRFGLGVLGTGSDETLLGGPNADWIDGNGGTDTLNGGPGNDTYLLFDSFATITIVEQVGGGIDLIRAAYEIDLSRYSQVENLLLMEAPGRAAPDGADSRQRAQQPHRGLLIRQHDLWPRW